MVVKLVAKTTVRGARALMSSEADTRKRAWYRLRHYTWVFVQPFLMAATVVLIWAKVGWEWGWHLQGEQEHFDATIMNAGVFFGVMAALIVNSMGERWKAIRRHIRLKQKDEFECHWYDRMPMVMHLILLTLSLPLMVSVMAVRYGEFWEGVDSVFATALGIAVFWIAGTELQDPVTSLWNSIDIPDGWINADNKGSDQPLY